jgi:hypothetical protein
VTFLNPDEPLKKDPLPPQYTSRCSFCGKALESVAKLIAAPGVFICNECVDLCCDILTSPEDGLADFPWKRVNLINLESRKAEDVTPKSWPPHKHYLSACFVLPGTEE